METQIPSAGRVPLTHLGVIRARGADASRFLQGQLTSDVVGLDRGSARLAGFCSAKGRLQASFIVWKDAEDDVSLVCDASLLQSTLKRLSMFVLRSQCKLVDASTDVPLFGLVGTTARDAFADAPIWSRRDAAGANVIRLPDAVGVERGLQVGSPIDPAPAPAIALEDWRWLEVQSGIPMIEAATVDRFVPQMLNFEVIGGVDFQKGCYPGQEVVARSQYRGTVKRRMFLFASDAAASAGEDIYESADSEQPAGAVVNAAPDPRGGWSALVEVKLAALEGGGTLTLGSPTGVALRREPLPYALA